MTLAWQVISLGGPAQLSLVTVLYAVGLLAFVLVGGVAADRSAQRFLMLAADLVRAVLLLLLGALSASGNLEIWHLAVGGLVISASEYFFIPSYTAIVLRLLPERELLVANGLEGTLRPLAQQAAGPVVKGARVGRWRSTATGRRAVMIRLKRLAPTIHLSGSPAACMTGETDRSPATPALLPGSRSFVPRDLYPLDLPFG